MAFTIFEFGPLKGGCALHGVTKSEVGIDPDSTPVPCRTCMSLTHTSVPTRMHSTVSLHG